MKSQPVSIFLPIFDLPVFLHVPTKHTVIPKLRNLPPCIKMRFVYVHLSYQSVNVGTLNYSPKFSQTCLVGVSEWFGNEKERMSTCS